MLIQGQGFDSGLHLKVHGNPDDRPSTFILYMGKLSLRTLGNTEAHNYTTAHKSRQRTSCSMN